MWHVRSTRLYLVAGLLLYGLAAGGSALSNLFHSYVGIGSWFDATLLGERLAPLPGRTQELTYFLFVDSAIEETLELIAIALLAAAILAFVEYLRQRSAEQDT